MRGLTPLLAALTVAATAGAVVADEQVPSDWVTISAANVFELRAPPGTQHKPSGIDYVALNIDNPEYFADVMLTNASCRPDRLARGESGQIVEDMTVDGRKAAFVHGAKCDMRGHPWYAVGQIELKHNCLQLIACATTASGIPTLRLMFGSIRFHEDHLAD